MSKGISPWLIVRRHRPCRSQTPPLWPSPHAVTLSSRSAALAPFHTQKPGTPRCSKLAYGRDGRHSPTFFIGLGIQLPLHGSPRRFAPVSILDRHQASLSASQQRSVRWLLQSDQYSTNGANDRKNVEESAKSQLDGPQSAPGAHQGPGSSSTRYSNEQAPPTGPRDHEHHESIATSVSKYLNFPAMPHHPTKAELLAAANGFWERFRVRFKWVSIRSMRPWNIDEWGAFVSWFMLGHIVWILVGTTTFFSILIFSINTVFAQGMSQIAHSYQSQLGRLTHVQKHSRGGLETI